MMKHLMASVLVVCTLLLQAQAPKLVLPIGHTRGSGINKQQFSPNGKLAITSAEDMTVKIWDISTGKLLHDLKGYAGSVAAVHFLCSPDNRFLATVDGFNTFTVFNLQTGEPEYSFPWASEHRFLAFSFLPGESSLFLFDEGGDAWKATGSELIKLYHVDDAAQQSFQRAAISSDNTWLAASSGSGIIKLMERSSGREVSYFSADFSRYGCSELLFSNTGSYLCAAFADHQLVLWNLNTFEHTTVTSSYKANYSDGIAFSGKDTYLAYTTTGEQIEIYDLKKHEIRAILGGHSAGVESLCFGGETGKLLTTGYDSTLLVWDAGTGALLKTLRDFHDTPGVLDYNEATGYFMAGIWNKTIGI